MKILPVCRSGGGSAIFEGFDKKGFSDYDFTPGYERTIKYDYRKYDKEADNILLKGLVLQIKEGYENGE